MQGSTLSFVMMTSIVCAVKGVPDCDPVPVPHLGLSGHALSPHPTAGVQEVSVCKQSPSLLYGVVLSFVPSVACTRHALRAWVVR